VQRNLDAVANGDPITSDPKTPSSRRTIHLSDDAVAYLRAQRQRVLRERLQAGAAYRDHDLVFCSRRGTPILSGNLVRSFHGLMRRLGLPEHLTPHTLRHTCATNLRYAGRPLPEVSQYLGHANQGVTATVYAHVLARGTRDAAEALARRYRAAAPSDAPAAPSSPASSPAAPPGAAAGAR
jgi:integrase